MTDLKRKAIGRLPLTYATVESFYDGSRSGTAEQCLKALCKSHERLRAELDGVTILLEECDAKLQMAQSIASNGWIEAWHCGNGFMAIPPDDKSGTVEQCWQESQTIRAIRKLNGIRETA